MPRRSDQTGTLHFEPLTFAHERIDGHLALRHLMAHDRTSLRRTKVNGNTHLSGSVLNDRLYAWSFETEGVLDMEGATVHADAYLRSAETAQLYAKDLSVDGTLDLGHARIGDAFLTRANVGALKLDGTDADRIDLRGATVDELYVDDLSAYELRIDDDTHLGRVYERTGLESVELGERETELLEKIVEREQPYFDRSGSTFTYDQLRKDTCMDAIYRGALGSLVQKGVIRDLDDDRYIARADPL